MQSIGALFSSMFEGAPLIFGSKYPFFFLELLAIIIVFDLIVFGWRPLVAKYAAKHYSAVDYIIGQVFNGLALVFLAIFTIYLGGQMGDTWGRWLGISGIVWLTVGIVAIIFLGRFATTRSFVSGSRRSGTGANVSKSA
jgi:hypothetical protein